MKKILAIILSLLMLAFVCGCDRGTDSEEVKDAGKLIVGITDCEPMNYKVDGEWTGFDTEFAKLFAKEELGVEVEFVEIDWAKRYDLLKEYEIDCIWNGMTIDKEQQTEISVSNGYVLNSQILVTKADKISYFKYGYDVENLLFAAENGSAGHLCVQREGFQCNAYENQHQALKSVANGMCDAAIVDYTFAQKVVGVGKTYSTLAIGFPFSDEAYGVGFRKDSDLTEMLNEFIKKHRDKELLELANKYDLTLFG